MNISYSDSTLLPSSHLEPCFDHLHNIKDSKQKIKRRYYDKYLKSHFHSNTRVKLKCHPKAVQIMHSTFLFLCHNHNLCYFPRDTHILENLFELFEEMVTAKNKIFLLCCTEYTYYSYRICFLQINHFWKPNSTAF